MGHYRVDPMGDGGEIGVPVAEAEHLQPERQPLHREPRQREAGAGGQGPEDLEATVAGMPEAERGGSGRRQRQEAVGEPRHSGDPLPQRFLPLERAPELGRRYASRQAKGKIVLTVTADPAQ